MNLRVETHIFIHLLSACERVCVEHEPTTCCSNYAVFARMAACTSLLFVGGHTRLSGSVPTGVSCHYEFIMLAGVSRFVKERTTALAMDQVRVASEHAVLLIECNARFLRGLLDSKWRISNGARTLRNHVALVPRSARLHGFPIGAAMVFDDESSATRRIATLRTTRNRLATV